MDDVDNFPDHKRCAPWMPWILKAAAVYNLLWGALTIAWPEMWFEWLAMDAPRYPQIWQCVGMIVGVYGIGYWIAARDPFRHWPIVLVGLLGKAFGPMGFVYAAIGGQLPWRFGATILTNDLIWWIPFSLILCQAFRYHNDTARKQNMPIDLQSALRSIRSHRGMTLSALSAQQPVMLIFLRHAGCTFCRETLADLALKRRYIESRGITLALVHMSAPLQATQLLQKYDLDDIHRFSDPNCALYEVFGFRRGTFPQLFSWSVLRRGLTAGLLQGHGFGPISGDTFRMAGVVVMRNSHIVTTRHASTASDRFDLAKLAKRIAFRRPFQTLPAAG
jgi:peroxiredoxin